MLLPPYYLKVVMTSRMACTVASDDVQGKDPSGALWIFSKGPGAFPYVFIITGKVTTLEPVYGPIFADYSVHTDSMAVMYSRLGGCLKDTTKLGSLANTDLWAWAKSLLDKLITHFRLGTSSISPLFWEGSLEEPLGLLTLALADWLPAGGNSTSYLGVSIDCLGICLPGDLSAWELVLPAWGAALSTWEL